MPAQTKLGVRQAPDYAPTIDRLMRRVRLSRLAPVDTDIPERSVRRVPVTASATHWSIPHHPRPLHLFERPEAIMVIAPVPDDPPRMMRWRGTTHRIAHATGPERSTRDWWRHGPKENRPESERIRDDYVIENKACRRFLVFRAGLHHGEAAPRWFIHSLF